MTQNQTNAPIDSFKNEYDFLSNFYPQKVTYNGLLFDTNEAAFQAQKEPARAAEFVGLAPGKSKRLGRQVKLRSDWDKIKDDVMYALNFQKFSENPALKAKLLATGDRELIEGNYWNDRYWGVCKGTGQNKLGKILMKIRDELQK